jgi:hypothetical protein
MQTIYSLYAGHPDKVFVENLRKPGTRAIIYLTYKHGNDHVLEHSGLYFHACPSVQELIDKKVIFGSRKILYLAYEDEFLGQPPKPKANSRKRARNIYDDVQDSV